MPAPRAPARLAVALATLAVALAGCTGAPPPAEEPAPTAAAEPEAGLVPTDEAANISAQESEASEFARSLDEKFHTHNYWGGALEKLLMDEDVASDYSVPGAFEELFPWLFSPFRFRRGVGFTDFLLPEGSIVPPETERLEVTVTWAASPTITGLQFAYMTAADENVTVLEPFPDGGGTVSVATTLAQNDMPHTTVSRWRLFLLPHHPLGEQLPGVFNGTVHVSVKAFRSDALYVAPPHPDHWRDATQLELLNASGPLQGTRAVLPVRTGFATGADDDGVEFLELPNGTVVPPHTAVLRLTLTWQNNATAADPFASHPELLYSPANTRRFFAPDQGERGDGRIVYTIPVDNRMVDSPYAEASSWAFLLLLDSDAPTDLGGLGDVGAFEGTYALAIVAEREVV